jgi:tRNA A-37 threonylcarbamoyl transferase component Bud32
MSNQVASATHIGTTRLLLPTADQSPESFVDAVCDYLEQQYRQGQRPSLRKLIDQVPREYTSGVFTHALELDLNNCVDLSELPKLEAYLNDFPEFEPILRQEFRRRQLAEFFVGREIGHGGMGCVYKALHTKLRKVVAVKRLHDERMHDPERRERFEREMQAAGRLDHPNVVRAEHAGEVGGVYFLAMEFIDGIDLSDMVERHGRLKPADACAIASAAAAALGYAHDHGLIHRDVKPHNLMLTRVGQVKLLDLGLARMQCFGATPKLTAEGQGFGTVDYMAPEQFRDAASVTRHADVYSLGCTLFHLLAGRAPFGSPNYESLFAKMNAHHDAPVPDLAVESPGIPQELAAVVARMMAKRREDRFDQMENVRRVLAPLALTANLEALGADERWASPRTAKRNSAVRSRDQVTTQRFVAGTAPDSRRTFASWGQLIRDRRLALGLLLAIAGFATWMYFALRPDSKPNLEHYPQIEAHLATLPGLHGDWWFDETPWLIPEVRKRILAAIRKESGAPQGALEASRDDLKSVDEHLKSGNAQSAGKVLRSIAERFYAEEASYSDSRANSRILQWVDDTSATPDDTLARLIQVRDELVARAIGPHGNTSANPISPSEAAKSLSATDSHLLAVVLHKSARLDRENSNRSELWRECERVYKETLNKYGQPNISEIESSLAPLFGADFGQMYLDSGNWIRAAEELNSARLQGSSTPHVIWVLCAEASAKMDQRSPNREDASDLLQRAMQEAGGLPESHPLRAHVFESTAWFHMNCWAPNDAEACFLQAMQRRQPAAKPGTLAQVKLFHNRHGNAMVLQYRKNENDTEAARQTFTSLLSDLSQQLDEESIKNKPWRALVNRKVNSMIRDADCFMFNDPRDAGEAARRYGNVVAFVRKYASSVVSIAELPNALYRQSLAATVAGDPSTAKRVFDEAELEWQKLGKNGEQESLALLRCVAGALIQGSNAAASDSGPDQFNLEAFLKGPFAKDADEREGVRLNRDEDQILVLYCDHTKSDIGHLLTATGVRRVLGEDRQ